jgi:hypothetical protein
MPFRRDARVGKLWLGFATATNDNADADAVGEDAQRDH